MAATNLCAIEGCGKRRFGRGLCSMHYARERKNTAPPCKVPGCDKPAVRLGWCSMHLTRYERYGDPLKLKSTPKGALPAFMQQAIAYDGDDCLFWPFARKSSGAGKFAKDGKAMVAARVVCEAVYGPPPTPRHDTAHSCGKGHLGCVAPRHLRWATRAENQADRDLHGTMIRGEQHKLAKLTADDVRQIRAMVGTMSMQAIADCFGVSMSLISLIHRRKRWSWLD